MVFHHLVLRLCGYQFSWRQQMIGARIFNPISQSMSLYWEVRAIVIIEIFANFCNFVSSLLVLYFPISIRCLLVCYVGCQDSHLSFLCSAISLVTSILSCALWLRLPPPLSWMWCSSQYHLQRCLGGHELSFLLILKCPFPPLTLQHGFLSQSSLGWTFIWFQSLKHIVLCVPCFEACWQIWWCPDISACVGELIFFPF